MKRIYKQPFLRPYNSSHQLPCSKDTRSDQTLFGLLFSSAKPWLCFHGIPTLLPGASYSSLKLCLSEMQGPITIESGKQKQLDQNRMIWK